MPCWGRNSSVGSAWARCPRCRGFDPPLGTFSVEGIFPLELTWVQTQFAQNSFGWEYKPRSSLCTHAFHRTDSKDPDVHVLDGWMPATKNTPSTHHPRRRNVTTLMVGLKKRSHTQKSHPRVVNPRDIAGERKKTKKTNKQTKKAILKLSLFLCQHFLLGPSSCGRFLNALLKFHAFLCRHFLLQHQKRTNTQCRHNAFCAAKLQEKDRQQQLTFFRRRQPGLQILQALDEVVMSGGLCCRSPTSAIAVVRTTAGLVTPVQVPH